VHVTLRSEFRPLRSEHVFPTVCLAIAGATRRAPERFRILHFSVQWDHVHLIVEASDERALSGGVRSVAIVVSEPETWLAGVGWRRAGLVGVEDQLADQCANHAAAIANRRP